MPRAYDNVTHRLTDLHDSLHQCSSGPPGQGAKRFESLRFENIFF